MKVLLIYPEFPPTFWSFKYVLQFIAKKASEPPLGLLTVAAMLPEAWEKKLVNLNTGKLTKTDIQWADLVFISGMDIQRKSFERAIEKCNESGVKVAAGGPMVTEDHESFSGVDYFILNEAELTLSRFIEDLQNGCPSKVYASSEFADLSKTPSPDWSLLKMKNYASMDIQYSRGCPFNCDFCSITALFGHKPRVKETSQFINELDSLYESGWRGSVFIVDDNFIGNKKRLKEDMLPALIAWQKAAKYPFTFTTEVSINLSDDEMLMDLMTQAGFHSCFVGIESPEDQSLNECGKIQNQKRDLVESVKTMQRNGFNVMGGFIVGFDSDPDDIFEKQANFIKKSGIVTAMVGLLNAPLGTRLYRRLEADNRILNEFTGDNTDGSLNFIPRMNVNRLKDGYKNLVNTIYSPKVYFERIKMFLFEYRTPEVPVNNTSFYDLRTLFLTVFRLGVFRKNGKRYFWKLFGHTLRNYPNKIGIALTMAVYGYHFQKVADSI